MGIGFETEVLEKDKTDLDIPAKVVLYDDDWHTFDEVIEQLMKALGCDYLTAEKYTMEVHTKGKAVVFEGDFEEALKVASILEEIDLSVEIFI
ncbi:ATP-dependent Clp protease adaptor ClpS [Hydrogenothermus marinus]|uniref:ATP-dependent Clp protease adaptor protein ClpS n=1 Tax=Hydrogenothermus marinus TaxID=133270 RepID=A0A3M0B7R0_9AQUI|nr:ATP-dependent Clp protease adaptor ClpS [Hydrogenothermus marinus]RMA92494.1 ATP-dependent Clp protease adaptor protein ClpS [Hydrogenothermus marinus]